MTRAHLEASFENEIVAHLVAHGWHQGDRTSYRRDLGLDTGELYTFLGAPSRRRERNCWHCTAAPTGRSSGSPAGSPTI